jgi:glutathione synthase/RimK-type ligase-like ATP-grasp enzyme
MNNQDSRRYVGIMANESGNASFPPFAEKQFYARLCAAGRAYGLDVFVFSPLRLDEYTQTVRGYTFLSGADGWTERDFPLPDLIYDRAFFVRREDYERHKAAVRSLHALKRIPYLGNGLKSKWEMLGFLRRDPKLRPYLPKTERLGQPDQTLAWLKRSRQVFLKPEAGSQGKGTLMAERTDTGFRVQARDYENNQVEHSFPHELSFIRWLRSFTGKRRYLIQQYLELTAESGEAWDIRALVQKNNTGRWELAGLAVRLGGQGSITSNIHGGGEPLEAEVFLKSRFGPNKAAEIMRTLQFLIGRIPPVLEASNGRMAELGLDLGVDRNGRVWIIEVNTKPGRSVFRTLGRQDAIQRAERNPIAYAHHLLTRSTVASGAQAGPAKPLVYLP